MAKDSTKERSMYGIHKNHIYNGKTTEEDCIEMQVRVSDYQELNPNQEKIAMWLEKLKFRKQLVGGINEYDVWKKIVELNAMYEDALKAERIRYDIIIDHYKNIAITKEVYQERQKVQNE